MKLTVFFMGCIVSWVIAFRTGSLLFHKNRENLNPLDWKSIDRCLLLISIYFVVGGVTGFMGGIRSLFQVGHVPWVDFKFWDRFLPALIVLGLVLFMLWMVGLYLRRRDLESRLYIHAVVQFSAVVMALTGYVFGPLTDPKGFLVGIAQGTLSLILFGLGVAIPWAATYTLVLTGLMTAVWSGLIPYAPFYVQTASVSKSLESLYWLSMLAQDLMLFLLLVFLIAFVVARWRDRENKLADMSAFLRKMFGRYLSTEVMKSLMEDPLSLELGGKRRTVTIMMTDLRGFTAMSERLDPEEVVQILNAYFEVMVSVVLRYGGTINEIIGDALVVIFGAPEDMEDRVQKAVACAIEMQNAMAGVNRMNREQGLPEIEMGIGLNEAEVVVGNIGSSKRSSYTAIGGGVNMASRIESYTVGGQVLVSESVLREAGDMLRIDGERSVWPKGAEKPLKIYDVGGIAGPFNLVLEETEPPLSSITRSIRLKCSVIEGKHVDSKGIEGRITALSKKSAEIHTNGSVDPMSNIRLNILEAYEALSKKDFYGKVIRRSGEDGDRYIVRFTAVPPDVYAYLQAHLKYTE